ncbi:MAG: RNA polymerase sigma factor [Planctomycetota bacterium]
MQPTSLATGSALVRPRRALARELERHVPSLRRFIARRVPPGSVDDVVQETLLRALERASTFDGERPLAPWLYALARSVAARDAEREARAPLATPDLQPLAPEAREVDPAGDVREMLDRLPAHERVTIVRHDLDGESIASIARSSGVAEGTVRARLSRGRRRLLVLFGVASCLALLAASFIAMNRRAAVHVRHASFVVERTITPPARFETVVLRPRATGWQIQGATTSVLDVDTGRLEHR